MNKHFIFPILFIAAFSGCRSKEKTAPVSSPSNVEPQRIFAALKQPAAISPLKNLLSDSSERILQKYILDNEYSLTSTEHFTLSKNYALWFGNDAQSKAFASEQFGMANYVMFRIDTSTLAFENALKLYEIANDSAGMARSYSLLGTLAEINSEYASSIQLQYKALQLHEALKDTVGIMEAKVELAYIIGNKGNIEIANQLMKEAEGYFIRKKDSIELSALYNSMAEIHYVNHNYVAARKYTDECLKIRTALQDSLKLSISINFLGLLNMSANNWDKAIESFEKAIQVRVKLKQDEQPVLLHNLATCYFKKGNYPKAIELYLRSISVSKNNPEYLLTNKNSYKFISKSYEALNQFEKALEAQTTYYQLKDSIDQKVNSIQVHELTLKYQNREKEKAYQDSLTGIEKARYFNLLLVSASGIIIILLLISIYLIRQRNRKRAEYKEKQLKNIEKELVLRQEQLLTFTSQLADRSRIIQELENALNDHPPSPPESEDEVVLEQLLQMKILTEDDWRVFRLQFELAFPGLMLRLHARYPFLTGAEQRTFLLIRLCSGTREIAELLGISLESVRKAKYRLKKKLNLGENTSIDEFIRQF